MPDIDSTEIIGEAPRESVRPPVVARLRDGLPIRASITRPTWWAIGALVLALVAVGVLGGLLYADRRQTADERAAAAIALAWARAIDRHDLQGVQRTTVPGARVVVVAATGPIERPFRSGMFAVGDQLTFSDTIALRVVGDPVPGRNLQVALTTVLTCEGRNYPQLTVLNLQRVGSALKVGSAVMTAATTPASAPSTAGTA